MFSLPVPQSLSCLLRGAIRVDGAVGGGLFAYRRDNDALDLITHVGLSDDMVAFVHTVTPGDGTATGDAVVRRHRIVIRDVANDYYGERRISAVDAGIGAVTAVPLISAGHDVEGVFSLYYAAPHHPSMDAMNRIMRFAEIALRLLRISRLEAALNRAPYFLRERALSPTGRQAMQSASTLLAACDCGTGKTTNLELVGQKLDRIDMELSDAVKAHVGNSTLHWRGAVHGESLRP